MAASTFNRITVVLLLAIFSGVGYGCGEESSSCAAKANAPCACPNGSYALTVCDKGQLLCSCQAGVAGTTTSAAGATAAGGTVTVTGVAGVGAGGNAGANGGGGGKISAGAGGKVNAGAGAGTGGRAGSSTGGSGATAAGGSGGASTGPHTAEEVCTRWKADRANLSEGTWSGDTASCNVGDISADGRANALRALNLYRWLADLPEITTDPSYDKQAQACALMMTANGKLSHTPTSDWKCYTDEGATAAGKCNISSGPGVNSVDGYMIDPGNPTTIGHRRWILSNTIGPTGLGSTGTGASCMWTMGNSKAGKPWMAWPAPGAIPIQALKSASYFGMSNSVDSTGWTVQSERIGLTTFVNPPATPEAIAQVTVTSDGTSLPVTVTPLGNLYGATYAIRFNPSGWQTTAGKTYSVSVSGTSTPINYDVQVVDCP